MTRDTSTCRQHASRAMTLSRRAKRHEDSVTRPLIRHTRHGLAGKPLTMARRAVRLPNECAQMMRARAREADRAVATLSARSVTGRTVRSCETSLYLRRSEPRDWAAFDPRSSENSLSHSEGPAARERIAARLALLRDYARMDAVCLEIIGRPHYVIRDGEPIPDPGPARQAQALLREIRCDRERLTGRAEPAG